MATDHKHELHALIDQLGDDAAAETLAFARQLLSVDPPQPRAPIYPLARPHAVPALHRATTIVTIDDLHAPLFAEEENAEAFDDAIQRWRAEPESD